MSPCTYYKTGDYNFCWIGWAEPSWDRCVPSDGPEEILYFSSQSGVMCVSHCGRYGYGYDWCYSSPGDFSPSWARCSSKPGHSSDGRKCIDRCQLNGALYKCYVAAGSAPELTECSPAPIKLTHFQETIGLLKRNECPDQYPSTKKTDPSTAITGVLAIAAELAQLYGEQPVVGYGPRNSVTSYVTFQAPTQQGLLDIELPVVVRASIIPQHLKANSTIPTFVAAQMKNMNAWKDDTEGYLVGSSLSGPDLPINFVPKISGFGKKSAGKASTFWGHIEREIYAFLDGKDSGRVDYTIVLMYDDEDDLPQSRRPVGFGLNTQFYDVNGKLVRDSGDCYFSNVPEGGSIDHRIILTETQ